MDSIKKKFDQNSLVGHKFLGQNDRTRKISDLKGLVMRGTFFRTKMCEFMVNLLILNVPFLKIDFYL